MRIHEIKPVWSNATIGEDVLVVCDAEKIRAAWENDEDFYFDGPHHPNAIKGRIERFGEWIKRGEAVRAPEVCLNAQGEVFFTNGRHRFVWMLQHGVKHLPLAVPKDQVEEFKTRFG